MSKEKTKGVVNTKVLGTKVLRFEYDYKERAGQVFNYQFNFQEDINQEKDLFHLLVSAFIVSDQADEDHADALIAVENIFYLNDIKQFQNKDGKIVIPTELDKTYLSISYSHTRAFFYEALSGTKLQDCLLPIVTVPKLYQFKLDSLKHQSELD